MNYNVDDAGWPLIITNIGWLSCVFVCLFVYSWLRRIFPSMYTVVESRVFFFKFPFSNVENYELRE